MMKENRLFGSLLFSVIIAFVAFIALGSSAMAKFTLADIPEIKNKTPIHVVLEAGGSSRLLPPYIKKFSEVTGVKVTYESLLVPLIYPKLNVDFASGSGAYDVPCVQASNTNEWAKFLYPVEELAKKYDPKGVEGLMEDLKGHHPFMLRVCSDVNGRLMGMPYYTYDMVMFYRQDVLEHPGEKANFKKKYGYELDVPKTWDQVKDIAEFFTRKKGELLKGEPLKEDLFGTALMAGQTEINDEIATRIWSQGQDWATLIRDKNGKPKEYVITKANQAAIRKSLEDYKALLQFASPGSRNAFWDFVTAQFVAGKTILIPHLYVSLGQWAYTVQDKIPGAKRGIARVVGKRGYTGNFYQAVAKKSKNPEAGYWLLRYLGSYEIQKAMMEKGWSGVRRDVYEDPEYRKPERLRKIGNRGSTLLGIWYDPDFYKFVDNAFYFTSDTAGRVYEAQIILCHEAATGKKTIDEAVKEIIKETVEFQNKFGSIPMRVEK